VHNWAPRRRFFDLWSRVYDAPAVQRAVYLPVQDAILRALVDLDPSRVLDVGCGTGLVCARLDASRPATVVVGCDLSAGMLERAAARTRRVGWVQGRAESLPLATASFDAVFSTDAFHWVPDQTAALREFARVVAPGGRVLLAMVNPSETVSEATHQASVFSGQPLRWPTRQQLRADAEASGLRVERQTRLYRGVPSFLLPSYLTVAVRDR
jgi:ubiquinone/menaquinone biosynthesis C-methylase UbiE